MVLVLEDVRLCFLPLSTLWWMRIRDLCKLPDGSDWLWGKLDLALVGSDSKESARDVGDLCSVPGEGNGYPLQYSCLENPMDKEAWWPTVLGGHKESNTTEWLTLLAGRAMLSKSLIQSSADGWVCSHSPLAVWPEVTLWPPDGKSWLIGKDPDAGKDWRQVEKGMTEDEMVGWQHWLYGHEFE